MPDTIHEQSKRLDFLMGETQSVYHEATLRLGLTDSTMDVLYTLCQFDGACPLRRIIALSGMPKQTVNSALRKLEGPGALPGHGAAADGHRGRYIRDLAARGAGALPVPYPPVS